MKRILVSVLLVLTFIPQILAQEESEEPKAEDKKSKLSDKFFLAFTTSTYMDMLISPLRFHYTATENTDVNGNIIFASVPYQSFQYNIVSLGLEPRLNLKEFDDDKAITLAAPISIGIGICGPAEVLKVNGASGFGSLQIPVLLKLFVGNGSTYKTRKDFGFNIGGGLEMTKVGLINTSGENRSFNNPFVLPCLTAGFLFMRGDSPMEINIKYAFGRLRTQEVDSQGFILKDNSGTPYIRTTRGQTIKLSFVYLMNY